MSIYIYFSKHFPEVLWRLTIVSNISSDDFSMELVPWNISFQNCIDRYSLIFRTVAVNLLSLFPGIFASNICCLLHLIQLSHKHKILSAWLQIPPLTADLQNVSPPFSGTTVVITWVIRGTKNDHRLVAMPIDFKITLSWVIIVVTVGICTTKALNRLLTVKAVGRNALVKIKSPPTAI